MRAADKRLVVITGGPGSGKTSLVSALAARGFHHIPEAGRAVIRQQRASGGIALPEIDPDAFADAMLCSDLRGYADAMSLPGTVIFDRSIIDVIGYRLLMNLPVPEALARAARQCRYDRHVFLAPFWPDIYQQDSERKQDVVEARRTCGMMEATYPAYGYTLLPLPFASVAERVAFVLAHLERGQ